LSQRRASKNPEELSNEFVYHEGGSKSHNKKHKKVDGEDEGKQAHHHHH